MSAGSFHVSPPTIHIPADIENHLRTNHKSKDNERITSMGTHQFLR